MLFCIRLKYSSKVNFACRKLIHFYRQFTCTWHDPPLNNWVRQPRQLLFQISGAICLLEVLFISFQSGTIWKHWKSADLFIYVFISENNIMHWKKNEKTKEKIRETDRPSKVSTYRNTNYKRQIQKCSLNLQEHRPVSAGSFCIKNLVTLDPDKTCLPTPSPEVRITFSLVIFKVHRRISGTLL